MRWLLLLAACGSSPEPAPVKHLPVPARSAAHTISSGAFHTCARTSDGRVACWGQLANGATVLRGSRFFAELDPVAPQLVPGIDHVAGVLAGHDAHCAWTDAGGASCWGAIASQVYRAPAPIAALHDVVQIDGGALDRMLCALQRDGRVQCWGDDKWHDHAPDDRGKALVEPTALHAIPEIFDAVEIAVGFEHACARRRNGVVACWDGFAPAVVTPIGPAAGAISLAGSGSGAGSAFAALLPGGKLYVWQLPDPLGGAAVRVPEHVDGVEVTIGGGICVRGDKVACFALGATDATTIDVDHAVAVTSGAGVACARLADGSARCWGEDGLRGDRQTSQAIDAVDIPGLADVQTIAIDGRSTCAVANGGKVLCWGAELAHEPTSDSDYPEDDHPIEVPLPAAATTVAMENGQACAVLIDKRRFCWGNLGGKTVETPRFLAATPARGGDARHRELLALPGITGVYSGGFARESWSCVSDAKDLHCLSTYYGRGETDYDPEHGFAHVAGGREAISVPPGAGMCIRLADGIVKCGSSGIPTETIFGVAHAVQLAHGPDNSVCARLTDGTVACWPEELRAAKLGPGPTPVRGATDAIALAAGPSHACIIRGDRTLRCWGAWSLIGKPIATSATVTAVADLAM